MARRLCHGACHRAHRAALRHAVRSGLQRGAEAVFDPGRRGAQPVRLAQRAPAMTLQALRERFRNRPDSEHAQALVRLAIAALIVAYLTGLWAFGDHFDGSDRTALLIILAEACLGLGILVAIALRPGASTTRRVVG